MTEKPYRRTTVDVRLASALAGVALVPTLTLCWWALANADRLPDPVARHWGVGGGADGFSSLTSVLWLHGALSMLLTAAVALPALFARETPLRRGLAATAAFLPVFLATLVADSLRVQVGLRDATAAPAPEWGLVVGVLLGSAAAAGAWSLVRVPARELRRAPGPPRQDLPRPTDGHSPDWNASIPTSRALTWVLGLSTAILLAIGVVAGPGLLVLAVLIAVLMLVQTRLRVRITADDGLVVGLAGIRLLHVAADEVTEARVTTVDPWNWGGWGVRVDLDGRVGVVTRKGEALQVLRGDGSQVFVSIDDASTAAAALHAAADRAHQG